LKAKTKSNSSGRISGAKPQAFSIKAAGEYQWKMMWGLRITLKEKRFNFLC
jgi:hypothetical protein